MATTIDDIMGTARPPTIDEQLRTLELHRAIVTILGAQVGPSPSGHVYALVMPGGYTLAEYEAAIALMVRAGRVRREGDLLTWVSP